MQERGNTMPATRGDAEAVLRAFGNGGWAVLNHNRVVSVGPADLQIQVRPFPFFDGRHYCSLDWHTILIADFEGGDRTFTHQQASAIIDEISVQFSLDGAPLQITQTPVARFLNPQLVDPSAEVAFYSQWGSVMSPSDLTVGQHTLSINMTAPAGGSWANTIHFFIDAGGTGACQ
jgi:hypothetical protein